VTDDGADARDVRAEVSRDGMAASTPGVRLPHVGDHHRAPRARPEHPPGVDRSGVAASCRAKVHTPSGGHARHEVGRGYGPEKVPGTGGDEEANGPHEERIMRIRALAGAAGVGALVWALVVRGSLWVDLGVGRRYRPLGPIAVRIAAPRDIVFEVVSAPYLEKAPRALREKVEVLERGEDLVLAAHRTRAYGLTATTVETVRFEAPERVHFRLVRGPVPHVVETFVLTEVGDDTELLYSGELGTDLWGLGRLWGAAVARTWEAAVAASLESIRAEAERRARRG
jgi:hypothetical protein